MESRAGVRHMSTLTLLLVCVCPLCCRAGWMWLGLTSAGNPDQEGCASLQLTPRQRELCRKKFFLLPSIQDGARLAIDECQNQFRNERWNCSTTGDPSVFGHELTSGTKETAFLYAVMAAALVHAVTRSCSQGNMTECGCDGRLQGLGSSEGGWHWGGCSDHIQYGTWFSRRFMDHDSKNVSASRGFSLHSMNQHNSEAGRQAIGRTMTTNCRCHGVSGSCAVKTCWRTMASFQRVGIHLKGRYENSVQVSDGSRRKTKRKEQHHLPLDKHQFIYLNKSPNYCLEDRRLGMLGTRGRRCNRTSSGPDGCNLLCCGRGYNTHVVRHVQRCECKFVWCCYVRCKRCESMNDMHTCK
ncbi:protein Wnt-16 [Neosynchiropus ocellatus]